MDTAYLQLRWEPNDGGHGFDRKDGWLCHYELVLPLDEFDVRREDEEGNDVRDSLVIPIKGPSCRWGERSPCENGEFDAPYRDGAHSGWDSQRLGGIPIFVIAPDGTKISEPPERVERRKRQ